MPDLPFIPPWQYVDVKAIRREMTELKKRRKAKRVEIKALQDQEAFLMDQRYKLRLVLIADRRNQRSHPEVKNNTSPNTIAAGQLPQILDCDEVHLTYESVCIHLYTMQALQPDQAEAGATPEPTDFMPGAFDDLTSFYNLRQLWLADKTIADKFPSLETLCASYYLGPTLPERLMWYAGAAQLHPALWKLDDPEYGLNAPPAQTPPTDDAPAEPEPADTGEVLGDDGWPVGTQDLAMTTWVPVGESVAGVTDMAISTGDERVDPAQEPSEAQEGSEPILVNGEAFDAETGELVEDAKGPPSWLRNVPDGGEMPIDPRPWLEEGQGVIEFINTPKGVELPLPPMDTTGIDMTLVGGAFNAQERPELTQAQRKAMWQAETARLYGEYLRIRDFRDDVLKGIDPELKKAGARWKAMKEDTTWK